MAVKKKARLHPLNVAYGVGASVVITGLMFKFLHWQYANEMLFVGLATEAIVFFISAFELVKEEEDYRWEKIFPQLTSNEPSNIQNLSESLEKVNLDSAVIEKLANSIIKLEENVFQLTEASKAVDLQSQIERMKTTTDNFELEINKLNSNIARLSNVYEKMLEAMQNR